ncbi:MAG: DUF1223 domain-containing protein [Paracoccaceae bacterium]|nr:MAG: DUF1223 domain-containing protein [Paracoccaceae bacterium]
MRQIVRAALGLWLGCAAAGAGLAQGTPGDAPHPVVVELFTSQGCSSCPPADAILAGLSGDPRVIALALHVDYWDYLGWKDDFARPEFTKRQKVYAKAGGRKMVFTPQMIVAGQDSVVGNDPEAVEAAIRRHALAASARGQVVRLTVERQDDQIVIRAEAVPPTDRGLRVQLVRYRPKAQVDIARGENAGHSITYHNIVTSWQLVGEWRATAPLTLTTPSPGSDPAVVIVQDEGPGAVLAAVELR